MNSELVETVRKLSQRYAYTSIQMHEAIGRKAGLPGTDHKYLGFLMERGRMTAGELSALTGLTTGAVTGLIDRLEKKKLVKRVFAGNDRRKVFIEPNTKRIMALLQPLYKEFRNETIKLFASFSDRDLKALENYFAAAIGIMEASTNRVNSK